MAEQKITHTNAGKIIFPVLFALLTAAVAGSIAGCGKMSGSVTQNQLPTVEFTDVPANGDTFSYAPVIHWKGRDGDGFVENYSFADIIDSTALLDPVYYIPFIPPEAWKTTESTADTVYLLTETGKVTQHVFYLKCTDDRGSSSPVIYRSFNRTNRPPNVPQIKWFLDGDGTYANTIAVPDTLYCLDQPNETWPGLGFDWRSTDPDDRELYRIPLQYRYFLEKVPHDTVWQWVSRDWTTHQDLTFAGLPTGHYTFTVWARDDGYELSERPAVATFDVYQPSFDQSILLFNTTYERTNGRAGRGDVIPGTQIGDLYRQLAANYPDAFYFHYSPTDTIKPYKAFLGRFRLVVYFSESKTAQNADAAEAKAIETNLTNYVRIGGKLWIIGDFLPQNNIISNTTLSLTGSTLASAVSIPANEAEFTGVTTGLRDLPPLTIDTSKTGEAFRLYWTTDPPFTTYPLLPGVDIMTTGSDAQTVYYFKSYTDTANGDVRDDTAFVEANIDTIYYPPTPIDCIIKIRKNHVLDVTRVLNVTRNERGQVESLTNNVGKLSETVLRVSYPYGEPWATTDLIIVDYNYQPFSDFHLKPCAIRFEKLIALPGGTFEVRYRVAAFSFPLYFLDNSQGAVTQMFNRMLDWFFLPYAH